MWHMLSAMERQLFFSTSSLNINDNVYICCLMIRDQDHNLEIELPSNSQNFQIWSMHSNDFFLYIFQRTQHVGLVQSGDYYHLIECNLFSPWYSWKFVHFALTTINHSLNQRVSIFCFRNDSIMYDVICLYIYTVPSPSVTNIYHTIIFYKLTL
jgi:hypothetical protein